MMPRYKPLAQKIAEFWTRMEHKADTGCWEWTGFRDHHGYGRCNVADRTRTAFWTHRVAWELANGRPIPEGLDVCHSCDNPPCCNPEHLFLGTRTDNMRDALSKDRFATGERHPHSLLSRPQVQAIRSRLYQNRAALVQQLAVEFGVGEQYINDVAAFRRRKHEGEAS